MTIYPRSIVQAAGRLVARDNGATESGAIDDHYSRDGLMGFSLCWQQDCGRWVVYRWQRGECPEWFASLTSWEARQCS